jgi:hypothetical protein
MTTAFDSDHPATHLAMQLALGELSGDALRAAQSQLASDPAFAAVVQQATTLTASLNTLCEHDASFAVAPAQRAALAGLMPQASPRTAPGTLANLLQSAQEFVASLLFDSARTPALAGFRTTHAGSVRTLRYDTPHGEIALRLEPQPHADSVMLLGQCDHGVAAEHVELFDATSYESLGLCRVGADGYFEFVAPPRAAAIRVVRADGSRIAIPSVPLQHAQPDSTDGSNA